MKVSSIILRSNSKLIALHKGIVDENNKIKSGITIKSIIEKMNFIKYIYNINNENKGKEINIINKFDSRFRTTIDNMEMIIEKTN